MLIEEPRWLNLRRSNDALRVELGTQAPEGTMTLFAEPSNQTIQAVDVDGARRFDVPPGTQHFLLRFDDRWMARRFAWNEVER